MREVSEYSIVTAELLSHYPLAMGMYKGQKCTCSSRNMCKAWRECREGLQRGNLYEKEGKYIATVKTVCFAWTYGTSSAEGKTKLLCLVVSPFASLPLCVFVARPRVDTISFAHLLFFRVDRSRST